jgi:hypothetical protein
MPTLMAPSEIDHEYDKVMKTLDLELRGIRKGLNLDPTFKTDDEISGKERLRKFEELVYTGYNHQLSIFQKEFVEKVIQAFAIGIVGLKDWERYGDEICAERGWAMDGEIDDLLACTAPRRAGKTWALARCVAARIEIMALYTGSGQEDIQVVCSTGKRISTLFKECVMKFLSERKMADGTLLSRLVVVNNVEVIIIEGPNGARAKGQFLPQPQHEEGLRGISAHAVLLEEGGFMGERVWYQVVAPLLTLRNSSLVIISSPPKDKGHWFTGMLGEIPTLRITFICDKCLNEWKEKKGKLEICRHNQKYFPSHHDSARQKKLQNIYKSKEETYAREILGAVIEDDRRLFTDDQITGFLNREYRLKSNTIVNFIAVTCDPNVTNSPTSDEMALIASTQIRGNYVVSVFFLF